MIQARGAKGVAVEKRIAGELFDRFIEEIVIDHELAFLDADLALRHGLEADPKRGGNC